MKKLICILMALLMALSLAACGEPVLGNDEPEETKQDQQTEPSEEGEDQNEPAPTETKPETKDLKVVRNIYVTYPAEWYAEDSSRTWIIFKDETRLVGITCKSNASFEGELEDLLDHLSGNFANDAFTYAKGLFAGEKIEPTTAERSMIAGYECIKFVGTLHNRDNRDDWESHVYGYALLIEDRVMMITGMVADKSQDPDMIAEINALTDQIASSLRVEE